MVLDEDVLNANKRVLLFKQGMVFTQLSIERLRNFVGPGEAQKPVRIRIPRFTNQTIRRSCVRLEPAPRPASPIWPKAAAPDRQPAVPLLPATALSTSPTSHLWARKNEATKGAGVFQVRTQYGDWKGIVAADEPGADNVFETLFEATGQIEPDKEIMIGFEVYESGGSFYLAGYFYRKPAANESGWSPSLTEELQRLNGPIRVKKVCAQITLEQYFKHFKRFNVMLANNALDIVGRGHELAKGGA
jgi:hypothetical protein